MPPFRTQLAGKGLAVPPSRRPNGIPNRSARRNARRGALRCVAETTDIKIESQKLTNSRVRLTLTVPPEVCQKTYNKVVKDLKQQCKIPGFRKGSNVPMPLLISTIGGEQVLKSEVMTELVNRSTHVALQKWSHMAINDSDKLETDVAELMKEFDVNKPFVYDISFDVMTPLLWTGSYKDIKVSVRHTGDDESDRACVDFELRKIRKEKGKQRIVADRGLQRGDVGILDLDFIRLDTNESMPGMKAEKFFFDTELRDSFNVVEGLEGMRIGDTREFETVFPDDWEPEGYRGVKAKIVAKVHEHFEWDLPELNDEFVEATFPGMNLQQLKDQMLKMENKRRVEATAGEVQEAIVRELLKICELEVSETAIREAGKAKYQQKLLELQSKGQLSFDAIQQLASPELLNKFIETNKAELAETQRAVAALDAIFHQENLEVTEQDIADEMKDAIANFEAAGEEYDEGRLKEMSRDVLANVKVIEWFEKNGCITMLPYEKPEN